MHETVDSCPKRAKFPEIGILPHQLPLFVYDNSFGADRVTTLVRFIIQLL